jgi:UDP-N-acetylmuramate dehydrogenase
LEATLRLFYGDVEKARNVFVEWTKRKSLQPRNSPGCAFANLSHEDAERLGFPTTSAGYVVEHVLKMGDYRIGNAGVSTAHHNFVVNLGGATASDYLSVLGEIVRRTKDATGIDLIPEIFLLGFSQEELPFHFR